MEFNLWDKNKQLSYSYVNLSWFNDKKISRRLNNKL